jgi:hypothetical protein
MGSPPLEYPTFQDSPILLAFVIVGTFMKLIGASGTKTIFAPPPTTELKEAPYILKATIIMLILFPKTRLNGAAVSVMRGIKH